MELAASSVAFWGMSLGRLDSVLAVISSERPPSPFSLKATTLILYTLYVFLRQVGGFLRVLRFSPPIKLTATI
jgi:hypothetical protein